MFLIALLLIGFSSITGIIIYLLHEEQKDSKILREIEYNKFIAENNFQHSKFKQPEQLNTSENNSKHHMTLRKSTPRSINLNRFYSPIPKNNVRSSTFYEQSTTPLIIYDESLNHSHDIHRRNVDDCDYNHENINNSHCHHVNNHSHNHSSDYSSSHHSSDYSSSDNYSSDYSSSDCGSGGSFD